MVDGFAVVMSTQTRVLVQERTVVVYGLAPVLQCVEAVPVVIPRLVAEETTLVNVIYDVRV